MKPLPSIISAVALSLIIAPVLRAQPTSSPVDALARKLAEDPKERDAAARSVEAFLLNPDRSGGKFVSDGVDDAALGAVARAWTAKENSGRLAALVFLCSSNPVGEDRLREALSSWKGGARIKPGSEKNSAVAFFNDAADKAGLVLSDAGSRRAIETSIAAGDMTAVAVPGARAAIERARELRERRGAGNTNVFGPDRQVQDIGAPGSRGGSAAGTAAAAMAGSPAAQALPASAGAAAKGKPGAIAPAAQLPLSQGRPDSIVVPSPVSSGASATTAAKGGQGGTAAKGSVPNDGRVVPAEPLGLWDRVKDSVKNPLSDGYGFTFEGAEPQPVSFRQSAPALAYARQAKPGVFSRVIFYGHGAPGYMTVGDWGGDAADIIAIVKGKMGSPSVVDIKGCNTSSIGGMSVNPGRGISGLTRRVLYFSLPYLTGDRSEASREQLENDWDSDLARDVSRGLPGVKVCGFRTFGLVGDRVPVVGTFFGRREATDSDAILGSKACYINAKEVEP